MAKTYHLVDSEANQEADVTLGKEAVIITLNTIGKKDFHGFVFKWDDLKKKFAEKTN